jgi:hypothetical protein
VKKELRSGYTTGACAAAAAKGAALMLAHQTVVSEVCIDLPTGDSALFVLHGQSFSTDGASLSLTGPNSLLLPMHPIFRHRCCCADMTGRSYNKFD